MEELSPYIYVNLTLAASCLFFLLFLFVTYFTKKNMNNMENTIYRIMLIVNALCVVAYIIYYVLDLYAYYTSSETLYKLVLFAARLGPITCVTWMAYLAFYLLIITDTLKKFGKEKERKIEKNIFKFIIFYIVFFSVLMFFENVDVNLATGVERQIIVSFNAPLYIALLTALIVIIKNLKHLPKKKALPLFMILPISVFASALAFTGIRIVFIFIIMTAIDHLMYHTIENPDMKLINELELAKDQAEKANNAKSDFLSSMSHELRTPLNAILGLSQVIEITDSWDDVKDDSHEILLASQKLLELVDGILDINSLDNKDIEINNINYNIYDVFNDIEKNINLRIGDKNITFKKKVSDDIPKLLNGDKDKVKSVINNLLTNAIKYTNEGFVELEASCFIVKDKCNLRISVSDTGIGIKQEDLPYIFDKFYRSEENRDSDIGGTGLGLALTRSMVDLMDGKINVTSTYGEGSTFFVTISQKIVEEDNTSDTNTVQPTVNNVNTVDSVSSELESDDTEVL